MTRQEFISLIREELAKTPPLAPNEDDVMNRLSAFVSRATDNGRNGNGNCKPEAKGRIDWTVNLPAIIAALGLTFGGVSYLTGLDKKVTGIEQVVLSNSDKFSKYIPIVETAVSKNYYQDNQNKIQEERIQNLSASILDIRKTNTEFMNVLGNIREDLAAIRAKLSIDRNQRQGENR